MRGQVRKSPVLEGDRLCGNGVLITGLTIADI
jgi:hypothetical protein